MFGVHEDQVFPPIELKNSIETTPARPQHIFPQLIFIALLFAFLGSLPWLVQNIAAPRYANQSPITLEEKITSLTHAPTRVELDAFASQSEAFIQMGQLLYPRYFSRNNGLSSTNPWPAYVTHDFPRVGFLLLNERTRSAIFRTKSNADVFPQAADAIILGCQREDYIDVRLIAFPETDSVFLSAPLTEPCSP